MFHDTRLTGVLCMAACLMATSLQATPELDATGAPAWFAESKTEVEGDPGRVALGYLRLMEEGWYEVAYTLLTDTYAKLQGNDASAFAKDVKGKKDWHTYADAVVDVKPLGDGQRRVRIKSYATNEGRDTQDIIEFVLTQVQGRWLIEEMKWGDSADVEPLPRQLRFSKEATGAEKCGMVSSVFRRATRTHSTTSEHAIAAEPPPWLKSSTGNNEAISAVNGYVRAVASSRPHWARYFLEAEPTSDSGSENPADSNARIYSVGNDEHETDALDDAHCIVWRPVWFSVGSKLYVQAMAFDCVKSDGRWKVAGMTEGPICEHTRPEKVLLPAE